MPQPLDMANIAALNAMTEANMRSAAEAAAAVDRARQQAEELRQRLATPQPPAVPQAGGQR
ncbi:hypothetical protein AB0F71_31065 [Kitasatospora sp. NPDC028055]|uniref:hypothetical protein n=1 Tax=Kitasatospora sp. NPDC028055 TaxID=3155653 RepID=UPI0033CC2FCB